MFRDPVVEQIRNHMAKLADECDGDIDRLVERLNRNWPDQAGKAVDRRKEIDEQIRAGSRRPKGTAEA